MKLYDSALSGNAFKIRLFLSLLKLEYDTIPVDLAAGENRTPQFLHLNPRGQIPVLIDDGRTVWDSQAILVYLARRYGGGQWFPDDAAEMATVMQWLAVSENELLYGLARARAVKRFGRPWNLQECRQLGRAGLALMESHLMTREWLATAKPTIADVACFPYVALAPEADISLDPFAHVRGWIARMQGLPGYVGMEGIGDTGA